jgi:hypothetical protein
MRPLMPIDTGKMRLSSHIIDDVLESEIVGGVRVPVEYATLQNNTPWFRHPRGGQAFFVEAAIAAVMPQIKDVLEATIDFKGSYTKKMTSRKIRI